MYRKWRLRETPPSRDDSRTGISVDRQAENAWRAAGALHEWAKRIFSLSQMNKGKLAWPLSWREKIYPKWAACDAHSEVAFGVGHKRSPWLFILRFAKWPSVAYFLVKQKVGTTQLHEMQLTRKRREKKNGNITKSKKKRTRCHVNGIAQAKWSLMKKETALPTL